MQALRFFNFIQNSLTLNTTIDIKSSLANMFFRSINRPYHTRSSDLIQLNWQKNKEAINQQISKTREGHSYFIIPHFGKTYSHLSEIKDNIQQKECQLYENEKETKLYLAESKHNISQQQEKRRKIFHTFNTTNRFESILNYLFMGASKPSLDNVVISPSAISKLHIESEEFQEIGAALASAQGKRNSMEDAHLVKKFDIVLGGELKPVILTAIFDGHQGDECAKFAAANIEKTVKYYLEIFAGENITDTNISNALTLSLIDLSHAYNPENTKDFLYNLDAGCTANVVIQIDKGDIWIANCGDSRAIFVDQEGIGHQISEDATLDEPRYIRSIMERGGNIIPVLGKNRVNGRLAVPASLGDHWSKGVVTSRPNVLKLEAKEYNNFDKCALIQCCDGVFDVSTTEEVTNRIKKSENLTVVESAIDLLQSAYVCDSTDNLSVILRRL